jgi:Transglutaminase-like superfamily
VNKWRRFRKLPAPERGIFLRAPVLLPLTAAALRTIGFRRWILFLAKFAGHKNSSVPVTPESLHSARRYAQVVTAAAKEGIVHGKCFEQSIVLWRPLLRKQMPAELHIGARQSDKGFEAHACVEVQGNIVNDTEEALSDYVPFKKDIGALGVEPH